MNGQRGPMQIVYREVEATALSLFHARYRAPGREAELRCCGFPSRSLGTRMEN